jgi:hypothetical protein
VGVGVGGGVGWGVGVGGLRDRKSAISPSKFFLRQLVKNYKLHSINRIIQVH